MPLAQKDGGVVKAYNAIENEIEKTNLNVSDTGIIEIQQAKPSILKTRK